MSEVFRRALRHGEDCPPPEAMIEAMEHGAAGHEEIPAHVKRCPACQTELALFRGFEAGEVKADERDAVDYILRRLRGEESAPGPSLWQRLTGFWTPVRMGGFAVAAAALLLTIGLSTQWQSRRGTPETMQENDVLRSAVIRGISPQGDVAAFPDQIRWEPVPGAAEYNVTLSEVDRNVIFHKKFTTPALDVPQEVRTLMVPGKTVLLLITAMDSSGR